jgi:hypothetical protein
VYFISYLTEFHASKILNNLKWFNFQITRNDLNVSMSKVNKPLEHGRRNPGRHVAWATKLSMLAPKICGSSLFYLIHVTHRAPRFRENSYTPALENTTLLK